MRSKKGGLGPQNRIDLNRLYRDELKRYWDEHGKLDDGTIIARIAALLVGDEGYSYLGRAWEGRVYMNPPYGNVIGRWVQKLTSEYEEGAVSEAIALVPARTDTEWFARLRDYPSKASADSNAPGNAA